MALAGTATVKFVGDFKELKSAAATESKGIGASFATAGKVAAAGFAAIGASAIAIGKKSADTFATVGGEVQRLQRYTGGTAEEMSRLRVAFKQTGIETEKGAKAIGVFSKNLLAGKLDKFNLDLKDTHGKLVPVRDQLLKVSDRFVGMASAQERTKLATDLFGKAGADLLPILMKGSAGIKELEAQSDKLGTTLSGKDVDAVKQSVKAKRDLSLALEGLQIQIGRYVLPIITRLVTFFAEKLPIAIEWAKTALDKMRPVTDAIRDAFDKVWPVVEKLTDKFKDMVKEDPSPFLGALGGIVGGGLLAGFSAALPVITNLVTTLAILPNPVLLAIAALAAIGAIAFWAYKHFEPFHDVVDRIGRAIKSGFLRAIDLARIGLALFIAGFKGEAVEGQFGGWADKAVIFGAAMKRVVDWAIEHWPDMKRIISDVFTWIKDVGVPFVLEAMAKIVPVVEDVIAWFNDNWPGIKKTIEDLINFVRDNAMPIFYALLGAFILFTSPVTAFITLFGFLYLKFQGFRDAMETVRAFIVDTLWPAMQRFWDWIMEQVEKLRHWWDEHWNQIKISVETVWNGIYLVIKTVITVIVAVITVVVGIILFIWDHFGQQIIGLITTAWNFIKGIFHAAFDFIMALVRFFIALFQGDWSKAWEEVLNMLSAIWEGIKSVIRLALGVLVAILGTAWETIKIALSAAWTAISWVLIAAWDGLYGVARGAWDKIGNVIKDGINIGIDAINKLIEGINWVTEHLGLGGLHINPIGRMDTGGGGPKAPPGGFTRPKGSGPGLASGGTVPAREVGSGFRTAGARAIVGEGKRGFPEYVIPTDPQHRDRAKTLVASLVSDLRGTVPAFASGGTISMDDATDEQKKAVLAKVSGGGFSLPNPMKLAGDLVGKAAGVFDWIRKVGAKAAFVPFNAAFDKLIAPVPPHPKAIAKWGRDKIEEWVAGADDGAKAALAAEDARLASLASMGGGAGGGWRSVTAALTGAGIPFRAVSTDRPGARTHATNSLSLHAQGRAVDLTGPGGGGDVAGGMRIFDWLDTKFASNLYELIYSHANHYRASGGQVRPIGALNAITKADHWDHVHAGVKAGGGGGGPAPGGAGAAGAAGWIRAAMAATLTPESWFNGLMTIAFRESSYNPGVVNNWDRNARNGNASRGLMQVVPTTFRENMLPGFGDIMNPIDNTIAAIRYIRRQYGDISRVQQANPNLPPKGYRGGGTIPFTHASSFDNGGTLKPGWNTVHNNTGADEHLVVAGSGAIDARMIVTINGGTDKGTVEEFKRLAAAHPQAIVDAIRKHEKAHA